MKYVLILLLAGPVLAQETPPLPEGTGSFGEEKTSLVPPSLGDADSDDRPQDKRAFYRKWFSRSAQRGLQALMWLVEFDHDFAAKTPLSKEELQRAYELAHQLLTGDASLHFELASKLVDPKTDEPRMLQNRPGGKFWLNPREFDAALSEQFGEEQAKRIRMAASAHAFLAQVGPESSGEMIYTQLLLDEKTMRDYEQRVAKINQYQRYGCHARLLAEGREVWRTSAPMMDQKGSAVGRRYSAMHPRRRYEIPSTMPGGNFRERLYQLADHQYLDLSYVITGAHDDLYQRFSGAVRFKLNLIDDRKLFSLNYIGDEMLVAGETARSFDFKALGQSYRIVFTCHNYQHAHLQAGDQGDFLNERQVAELLQLACLQVGQCDLSSDFKKLMEEKLRQRDIGVELDITWQFYRFIKRELSRRNISHRTAEFGFTSFRPHLSFNELAQLITDRQIYPAEH